MPEVEFLKRPGLPSMTSPGYAEALIEARSSDGGFGPRAGLPSEPGPTALAAIALDDEEARSWLEARQTDDGRVEMHLGAVENDSVTPLAALALDGSARERALDAVVSMRAARFPSTPAIPFDDELRGWSWTIGAFGWVEPTAYGVLALRVLRPDATGALDDGVGMLLDRECVGGGWNYGNRVVLGDDLPPYAQTTAVAMLALQRFDDDALLERGLTRLQQLWRTETDGGLSLGLATAALRANGDPDQSLAQTALAENFLTTYFLGDVIAIAWAAIATGHGLDRLMITP
jgi:hypothetical protein